MNSLYFLNGNITASTKFSDVVKTKIIYSYKSSTENSATNAWNLRFLDGNLNNNNNNNNKNNSNFVRAVCALEYEEKRDWLIAFRDCCRHKASSPDCIRYKTIFYRDLWKLALEVKLRVYYPTTSVCFIVTRPKPREIFAANFRDRIVQHWIMLRIRNFFEERFISHGNVSYNCRKGFGTLLAVQDLAKKVDKVTCNYTKDAYVGKFDLKSFFMSVSKTKVLEILIPFIRIHYKGWDKDTLLYLVNIVIKHCPLKNCIRRSSYLKWNLLPKYKSLFNVSEDSGLAIGNITSLEVANFFMSYFDYWIVEQCNLIGAEYIRFVDDFIIVSPCKEFIMDTRKEANSWLYLNLNLNLHQDKFYIQHITKGVSFVGSIIKPNRTYTSNVTIGRMIDRIQQTEILCKKVVVTQSASNLYELYRDISSLNSYMGFLVHNSTYGIRRKIFQELEFFWKCCYLKQKFSVVVIKLKFSYNKFLVSSKQKYELDLHRLDS